jgi:hypothetical protein
VTHRNLIPLGDKLLAFFEAHPHEWLSLEDVMTKFEAKEYLARQALGDCTFSSKVERVSVWRLKQPDQGVSEQVSAEVSKS